MLQHHGKTVAATIVLASGASAAINEWISVGSGIATIVASGVALHGIRRRKRRRPEPPTPPAVPLKRMTREENARLLQEWEIFRARLDQYNKDQKGQQ